MRRRLSHPGLRVELRAETLENVRSEHPEIATVLGLDAALEARLFEVLTDQRMAELEIHSFDSPRLRMIASQGGRDPYEEQRQRLADVETRAKVQTHDLLGDERFELYLGYMEAVTERREVLYFGQHLGQRDWLTGDQRERLIALLRVEHEKQAARDRAEARLERPSIGTDGSEEWWPKRNVELNEKTYRHMLEDSRALLTQLPAILTPRQLDMYKQMEASKLARQKAHVQRSRAAAGLNPEFDETELHLPARRKLITRKVRLELTVTVDPHLPVTREIIIENGSTPPAFEFPEGLWIEVTPTLDEDGWARVDYTYLEERGGKRFRIRVSGGAGFMTRRSDGVPRIDSGGGGNTIHGGRKTFVVNARIKLTAVE
jgi:hypothetical protein